MKLRFKKIFVVLCAAMSAAAFSGCGMMAVPAVNGIVDSAKKSSLQADAACLNNACKCYYMGIISGTINSKTYSGIDIDSKASNSLRKQTAQSQTVMDALMYDGLSYNTEKISQMVYTLKEVNDESKGTIYYIGDVEDMMLGEDYAMLSTTTTLGTLYEE